MWGKSPDVYARNTFHRKELSEKWIIPTQKSNCLREKKNCSVKPCDCCKTCMVMNFNTISREKKTRISLHLIR